MTAMVMQSHCGRLRVRRQRSATAQVPLGRVRAADWVGHRHCGDLHVTARCVANGSLALGWSLKLADVGEKLMQRQ